MSKTNQTIQITAEIKAALTGMDKVVSGLQKGLKEQNFDFGKNAGFNKLLDNYKEAYNKFTNLIKGDSINFLDAKDAIKSGEQVIKIFRQIESEYGNLSDKGIDMAKKLFPGQFNANIEKAEKAITQFIKKSSELEDKTANYNNAKQALKELTDEAEKLGNAKISSDFDDDLDKTKKKAEEAGKALEELYQKISQRLYKKQSKGRLGTVDEIEGQIKQANLNQKRELVAFDQGKSKHKSRSEITRYYDSIIAELEVQLDEAKNLSAQIGQEIEKIRGGDTSNLTKKEKETYDEQARAAAEAANEIRNLEQAQKEAFATEKAKNTAIEKHNKSIAEQAQKTEKLRKEIEELSKFTNIEDLFKTLKDDFNIPTDSIEKSVDGIKELQKDLSNVNSKAYEQLNQRLKEMGLNADQAEAYIEELKRELIGIGSAQKEIEHANSEMENLKNQVLQFFSITNSIQLFKRVVQESVETVKELDAVMTETAVVTDFTIGDMWEKLPEYSEQASNLGSSISDLYSATTLYYQQGLKTNEAMGVGVETMKMARIANMDATDATTAMTAALRGFNMEVNEMNAQKVNDVYSELAAITAADTSQIATAMGKTASIAASANMEFETTAALLAQIIETTQEAPETAGTAMKTIIARFTEVKELFSEGMLTSEDEEGEEININKIDAALRSVGISLKDFLNGSKGIDDIFLELASKWDTLDLATQRYIATTAAGSRQQSRFIAMMSNYDRTMELVTAANNSAGASQEQFNKTLDSLDAKSQQLKNAWNQFVMGLANDEVIKGGVTALTWLLETINKVIDALSGGNGLSKSIITLMAVIGALRGGSALFRKIFDSEIIKDFIKTMREIPNESKSIFAQVGQNIKEKLRAAFNDTASDARQAGAKAGQAYQEGFEIGKKGESLDDQLEGRLSLFDEPAEQPLTTGSPVSPGKGPAPAPIVEVVSKPIEEATEASSRFKQELGQLSIQGWQTTGMITALVGTAANWGATAVKAKDDTKAWGSGLQAMGTAATLAGSGMSLFAPILAKTTISLGTLLPWLGGAILAIGALAAVFQLVKNNSPEGKLEAAEKAANAAAEAADNAAAAYDRLASSLESIEGKEVALNELAQGTREWKTAVAELNNEVLDLIAAYPELAQFVDSQDGVLRFTDEDAVEDILNSYADAEINAQSAKAATQIEVQKRQQDVDFSNLSYNAKIVDQSNPALASAYLTSDPATIVGMPYGAYLSGQDMQASDQVDQKATEELARAYASGDIDENDAELAYLAGDRAALDELRAFGQSLIASEAAIDAYSEAILNNAAIASDLNDEQKSELEGLIGADGIQSLIDTEKGVLEQKTSEDLRKDYAEAMKYEIVDGKIYSGYGEDRKEVVVSDDEIKSQLAAISAQDKITKAMQALSRQSDNLSEAFKGLLKDSDGLGLTLNELDELSSKDFDWNALWESLPQAVQDLYGGNKEAFEAESQAEIAAANSRKQEMDASLRAIGKEELFVDNNKKPLDLDLGTLSQITDSLYNTAIQSGTTAAQELGDSVAELLKGDSSEQAQIFAEALNMIDWSSVESVEQLNEVLDDLGYTGNIAEGTIEELEDKIISASNATRNFNWDSFKEELKTTEELIEDIKGREDTERTFTEEQKDDILSKVSEDERAELEAQFIMTGADEWTYIGDSMQGLIVALDANTSALLGESAQQIVDQANRSQAWIDAMDSDIKYTDSSYIAGSGPVSISRTLPEIIDMLNSGDGVMEGITSEILNQILSNLGLDTSGSYDIRRTRLLDAYNQDYGANGLKAQENIAKAEPYLYDMATLEYSGMTGQQILSTQPLLQDQTQDELARMQAMESQLVIEGATIAAHEYANALEEITKNEDQAKKIGAALAIDVSKNVQQYENLAKSLEEYKDIITKTNRGTLEYKKGLSSIQKALKNTYNIDVTEEFMLEHQEILEKVLVGEEGTWEEYSQLLQQEVAEAIQESTDEIVNLEAVANSISPEVGVATYYDGSGFASAVGGLESLQGQIVATEQELNDMAALYDLLGATIEFETTTMWLKDGVWNMEGLGEAYTVVTGVAITNTGASPLDSFTPSGGGGGGGGSEEAWENPYDKLYNLTREINEELRERERIERRYEKLLEKRLATAEQLSELSFSELDQLELEAGLQREFISGRQQQIADLLAENPDMEQYFTVSTDENGEQIIRIDWDAINAVTDTEEGERIEEVLGKVEDWSDDIEDANDTLNDIEDTVFEIKERGKDEYMDLEDQIKEALTQVYQGEIDKLSDINDSINDTNSRLLDAVQRSIDEQRQERENAKTEEELSDKRSRLAYLQQDTSGANALEILKLQEEITQGEEDYTDSLIDQKISELQRQNDEAAAQREQQINIAQAQLDHYIETGAIWQEVYSLMTSGLNEKTGLIRGSRLEEVLQKAENFSGLSAIGKMEWLKDLETNIASALSYLRVGRQIEDLGITSGQISFTTKDGKTLTGTVDSSGNVTTSDGKVFDDVYQGSNGFYYSNKTEAEGTVKKPESPAPATPVVTKKTNPYGNASETTGLIYEGMTGTQVKSIQWALKEMGYDIGAEGIDGVYGWATKRAVTQFQTDFHREHPNERMSTPDGIVGPNTRNAFRIKQYKTGGLADFTGPAWLDGTKSRPEYILNADQTRAFFELVDVLSALKTNSSITTQNSGDNTYDIDINVESIGSDYDVEQLANTVKRLINDDARYRNNNIAGHTR